MMMSEREIRDSRSCSDWSWLTEESGGVTACLLFNKYALRSSCSAVNSLMNSDTIPRPKVAANIVNNRAPRVAGQMSPKPTVELVITVKYLDHGQSRGMLRTRCTQG